MLSGQQITQALFERDRTTIETYLADEAKRIGRQEKPLCTAILLGSADIVEFLLQFGANVEETWTSGNTPLFLAAEQGCAKTITVLLHRGADVNRPNKFGVTALMRACCRGHVDVVRTLIEAGADIHRLDYCQAGALSEAQFYGHIKIRSMLIDAGARQPESISTDLHMAVIWGNYECALRLVDGGANLDARNARDLPVLTSAVRHMPEIVPLLLDRGTDANSVSTAFGSSTPLVAAISANRVEAARSLITKDADVNRRIPGGQMWTPLIYASIRGRTEIARLLLDAGADIDASENTGKTALDIAVNPPITGAEDKPNIGLVRLLIERGASVYWPEGRRSSALSSTLYRITYQPKLVRVEGPRYKLISLLLQAHDAHQALQSILEVGIGGRIPDLPVSVLSKSGIKPTPELILKAAVCGIARIVRWALADLRSDNSNISNHEAAVNVAISGDHAKVINVFLDYGASPTELLRYAALQGKPQCVRLLLRKGADPNYVADGRDTALLGSAYGYSRTHRKILSLLLRAGANPNVFSADSDTPLTRAIGDCHTGCTTGAIRALLQAGADPNAIDAWGTLPLGIAVENDAAHIVRLLMDAGADINRVNRNGETPWNQALRQNRRRILRHFDGLLQKEPDGLEVNLHLAILYNKTTTALHLIENGVDLEQSNTEGLTYLAAAIEYWGNLQIARELIAHGAKVDYVDQDAISPLTLACRRSAALVRLLIEAGASVDPIGNGALLLIEAVSSAEPFGKRRIDTREQMRIAQTLLDASLSPNIRDRQGETPLHHAVYGERLSLVSLLLSAGATVDAMSDDHPEACYACTPLMAAVKHGTNRVVRLLLDHGADPNIAGQCGITPLMSACQPEYANRPRGHQLDVELLSMLVENGADVNAEDTWGRTALDLAFGAGDPAIVQYLEASGARGGSGVGRSSCGAHHSGIVAASHTTYKFEDD